MANMYALPISGEINALRMYALPLSGEINALRTCALPLSGVIYALRTYALPISGEIIALRTYALPISGEILALSTSAQLCGPEKSFPGRCNTVSWRCKKVKRKLTGDKANDIYGVMKIHDRVN